MFMETCSLAAETTLAWLEVSSALALICELTAESSSEEVIVALDVSRQITLRDHLQDGSRLLHGSDNGIEGLVDALNRFAVLTFQFRDVDARAEFAFHGSLGEHFGVCHHAVNSIHHRKESRDQFVVLRPAPNFLHFGKLSVVISAGHTLHDSCHIRDAVCHQVRRPCDIGEDSLIRVRDAHRAIILRDALKDLIGLDQASEAIDAGV
jgi:hypothetical protein